MLFLFARGLRQTRPDAGVAGGQRLRLVEGLGADLAGMVDAHQPPRMAPLLGGELRFRQAVCGIDPPARGDAGERAQRAVEPEDQRIDHARSRGVEPGPGPTAWTECSARRTATEPAPRRYKKNGRPSDARMITSNPDKAWELPFATF